MASQLMAADNNSSVTPYTMQSAVYATGKVYDGDTQRRRDDFTAIKEILSSSAANLDAGIVDSKDSDIEMKEVNIDNLDDDADDTSTLRSNIVHDEQDDKQ